MAFSYSRRQAAARERLRWMLTAGSRHWKTVSNSSFNGQIPMMTNNARGFPWANAAEARPSEYGYSAQQAQFAIELSQRLFFLRLERQPSSVSDGRSSGTFLNTSGLEHLAALEHLPCYLSVASSLQLARPFEINAKPPRRLISIARVVIRDAAALLGYKPDLQITHIPGFDFEAAQQARPNSFSLMVG